MYSLADLLLYTIGTRCYWKLATHVHRPCVPRCGKKRSDFRCGWFECRSSSSVCRSLGSGPSTTEAHHSTMAPIYKFSHLFPVLLFYPVECWVRCECVCVARSVCVCVCVQLDSLSLWRLLRPWHAELHVCRSSCFIPAQLNCNTTAA